MDMNTELRKNVKNDYEKDFCKMMNNVVFGTNNIIFTIKDTKLYVPVVTLSVKRNQKLSNFLANDLKDQCNGMNIKQKVRIKIRKTSIDIFLY